MKSEILCSPGNLSANVYSCLVHDHPKVETTQMCWEIKEGIVEQILKHTEVIKGRKLNANYY